MQTQEPLKVYVAHNPWASAFDSTSKHEVRKLEETAPCAVVPACGNPVDLSKLHPNAKKVLSRCFAPKV